MTATRYRLIFLIVFCLGLSILALLPRAAHAIDEANLLTAEQAFVLTATAQDAATITVEWSIAEGYYLYRDRFKFSTATPGIRLGEPRFPPGSLEQDEWFGQVETYHNAVRIEIPVEREAGAATVVDLKTVSQGCAEAGSAIRPGPRPWLSLCPPGRLLPVTARKPIPNSRPWNRHSRRPHQPIP